MFFHYYYYCHYNLIFLTGVAAPPPIPPGYLPVTYCVEIFLIDFQVQFLHCIKQTTGEGGENHFVDGFNIAEQLRAEAPEAFQVLSSVKFTFEDVGEDQYGEFRKVYERSVIG